MPLIGSPSEKLEFEIIENNLLKLYGNESIRQICELQQIYDVFKIFLEKIIANGYFYK
jgi:hypothetical protein